MFLKTYNTDFDFITTTLTDQNRNKTNRNRI